MAKLIEKKAPKKKLKKDDNSNDDHDEDGEEVVELAAPHFPSFVPAAASMFVGGNEEEIQLVGYTGNNALADFPHCKLKRYHYFLFIIAGFRPPLSYFEAIFICPSLERHSTRELRPIFVPGRS